MQIAIEEKISSPDSNRKILEEHEQRYGRFPKTLIFAVNDLRTRVGQLVRLAAFAWPARS